MACHLYQVTGGYALASANCTGACPRGHYCPAGTVRPIACAGGRYADAEGATSERCHGLCERGHFCPTGSVDRRQQRCCDDFYGAQCETRYCPDGVAAPANVTVGHYAVGGDRATRDAQRPCAARAVPSGGAGVASEFVCPSTTVRTDGAGNPAVVASVNYEGVEHASGTHAARETDSFYRRNDRLKDPLY